jgi:hypothetical protein
MILNANNRAGNSIVVDLKQTITPPLQAIRAWIRVQKTALHLPVMGEVAAALGLFKAIHLVHDMSFVLKVERAPTRLLLQFWMLDSTAWFTRPQLSALK